jgi:hypothetical protein
MPTIEVLVYGERMLVFQAMQESRHHTNRWVLIHTVMLCVCAMEVHKQIGITEWPTAAARNKPFSCF